MCKRKKILIHEALVASKLIYALEAIPIPKPMYDKIDAAYNKGLRQILGIKTTFGQKQSGEEMTTTNEDLLQRLSKELSKGKHKNKFETISDRIKTRAVTLLGKP